MNLHNILLLPWLYITIFTFLHEKILFYLCHLLFILIFLEKLFSFNFHIIDKLISHKIVSSHPIIIFKAFETRPSIRLCAKETVNKPLERIRIKSWFFIFLMELPEFLEILVPNQFVNSVMRFCA